MTNEKDEFPITSLSREDLDCAGFDISNIDDDTMERIASKMADDYLEQLFWISLKTIAEEVFNIPYKEKE